MRKNITRNFNTLNIFTHQTKRTTLVVTALVLELKRVQDIKRLIDAAHCFDVQLRNDSIT